jgi:hypothetical protein
LLSGITREQTGQMMADLDRFWSALGRPAPIVPVHTHNQVLGDLAELDEPGGQAAAA